MNLASLRPQVVYLTPNRWSLAVAVAEEVTRVELTRRLPDIGFEARDAAQGLPETPVDCLIVDGGCLADVEPSSMGKNQFDKGSAPVIRPLVFQEVRLSTGDHEVQLGRLARGRIVTVVDHETRSRLQTLCGDLRIDLHPSLGLLLPRAVGIGVAERRLRTLRASGAYPVDGRTVLVESGGDTSMVQQVLDQNPGFNVVILDTDGGAEPALEVPAETRARRVWRLGPRPDVEDLAGAMVGAEVVVAGSISLVAAAFAYGRPWLAVVPVESPRLPGMVESTGAEFRLALPVQQVAGVIHDALPAEPDRSLLGPLQAQVDAHFDRVAQVIEHAAWARRRAPSDLGGLGPTSGRPVDGDSYSAGLTAVGEHRLVQEERDALARREQEIGELIERAGRAEADLAALMRSRTFRYTRRFRNIWARLLQLVGRR